MKLTIYLETLRNKISLLILIFYLAERLTFYNGSVCWKDAADLRYVSSH